MAERSVSMKQNNEPIALNADGFNPVNVFVKNIDFDGMEVLRITKDPIIKAFDESTYARLIGSEFQNGIIEVKVLSRLLPDAPEFARGFIGVAFRIDTSNTNFEALYIRPTNGRSKDQLRRNRSVQYFSYPNYKFDRLRAECPGKYESYADMGLDEWIDLKIEVEGKCAKLYLHHLAHPILVVNDLKHGADKKGAIGLWVDVGTEGFFKDLRIASC
ncbi:hypothetical protein AALB39_21995 [Lachnospiraceae bacterium 54-53]